VADYERSPNKAKLRAAMTALAGFHIATADFDVERFGDEKLGLPAAGRSRAIVGRLQRLRELQAGGVDSLAQAISATTWPELAPLARRFIARLPGVVPPAIASLAPLSDGQFPLQPCLRDIWHDHVLFTGDEVTGMVDFGAVAIDTPATDIARLLGSLGTVPFSPAQRGCLPVQQFDQPETAKRGLSPSFPVDADTWSVGLAAYSSVCPLSADERHAVSALDSAGTILAGCNWIKWIYIEDRQFENRTQVNERFRRIVARWS
jgi:homoserine kinase type II